MSLLFVLYCLFAVFGFVKKDSKLVTVLILVFAWLIVGLNNNGPDYDNYVWRYEQNDSWLGVVLGPSTDYGFSLLCFLGNQLNLSFIGFKTVLAGISYLLIFSFLAKLDKNSSLVASCYLLSFFLIDVIQIRNFFAMSVLIFGFRFLLEPGRRTKNIIFYIVCSLIAASIHVSMVFSLLFLLSKFDIKWWHIVPAIALIFVFKAFFYGEFSVRMESDKLENYQEASSLLGGYFSSLIFLMNAAFISWVVWLKKKRSIIKAIPFPSAENVRSINLLLLLLIPFLFDAAGFSRLLKDVLIVNYSFLAFQLKKNERYLLYIYVLFFFWYYILGDSSRVEIFNAAFIYNTLL